MDSPSAIALIFTLLLALCSAVAFVLLYLRTPWPTNQTRGGTANGKSSSHRPTLAANQATATTGTQLPNSQMHLELQQGTLAHALGTNGPNGTSGSGTAISNASTAPLAIPSTVPGGRKAKKRGGVGGGGKVTTTTTNGSNGISSTGGRASRSSSSVHAPYVYPLDFLSAAPPVIVCLTTIPSRVHHIDKCLNSIKTQNYPIAQMMLAIPEESRREHTKYSIPDRVRKDAIISVVRVSHDYGPATALITAWSAIPPALQHRDTLIITLDDDQIYHPDTVATLVRHAIHHPDSAVSFSGYSLRGPPYIQPNFAYAPTRREERPDLTWRMTQHALQQQINLAAAQSQATTGTTSAALQAAASAIHGAAANDPNLSPAFDPLPDCTSDPDPYTSVMPNPNEVYESVIVDVLCGWRGGMCIRKKFLDEHLWREYNDIPSEAPYWANDEWISAQLAKNGVTRRVILAPFDSVLGRLRLRHGRNSSSASHLAHQQTILEYCKHHFQPQPQTNGSSSITNSSTTPTPLDQLQIPTTAQLTRLHQLIQPYQPTIPTTTTESEVEEKADEGTPKSNGDPPSSSSTSKQ